MSVIETMSAGYAAVARRPWVVLPPVVLDLLLWLGPSVTAAPWAQQVTRRLMELQPAGELAIQLQEFSDRASAINLLVTLAWQLPSMVLAHSGEQIATVGARGEWAVTSGGAVLGAILVFGFVGLVLAGLYLFGIASILDDGSRKSQSSVVARLRSRLGRFLLFSLLVGVAMVAFGLPVGMLLALVAQISPELGSFAGTMLAVLGIWIWLYLFFSGAAIFVRGRGPVAAIRDSISLVSQHFWPSLWLFLLVQIISIGTSIAWTPVLGHPIGVVAAIIGNAFIATGLTAAWMIFYQERAGTLGAVAAERAGSRR